MKQDHFATAAESASARNRQRDGVQGYDKRLMRGFCMCFENVKTASKGVHVRPHGVQRRSLSAVAKCACVQSKWAFLGAPTSDRSAVFASASNLFQTKRSSKKNRVQNSALTPSWRSKLAERLRGQHRYYKEATPALGVAFSRAKSLTGARLHLYWLFPHTQRQKMRACFGVDVAEYGVLAMLRESCEVPTCDDPQREKAE